MMGTLHWINGRHSQAERWWHESLAVALKVGARYEAALTHIEIGLRRDLADEKSLGEQWITECRAGTTVETTSG